MTNYYTSDLHLGHANIIKLCNRPFHTVEEMDHALIDNWNARVHRDDHVYIVGDFSFRSKRPVSDYFDKLAGHKHLIIGNHDGSWMRNFDLEAFFESVDNELMIVDRNRHVIMNHYPLMTFPRKSYLVYGHIHNDKPASYWPVLKTYEHALNASVEVNGYMPVTLDELITNNAMWRSDEA
ncbi:MAG: hypothetical protein GX481_04600 [Atopobium sp.]|nr:hypothetical protein [Atopobium sp.]